MDKSTPVHEQNGVDLSLDLRHEGPASVDSSNYIHGLSSGLSQPHLCSISACSQQATQIGLNSGRTFREMPHLVGLWYEEKRHTWGY